MLLKKNRADKRQIDEIFKKGKSINSPNLTLKFIINSEARPNMLGLASSAVKISFIAPKSAAKNAVRRNSLRRRGYIALAKYLDKFPAGLLGAFVFKKPVDSILELEKEIKIILEKL